jgi:hypothetical protein
MVKIKKLHRRNKALVTIFSTIITLKTLFCNSSPEGWGTLRTSSERSPEVWELSVHLQKVHPKSGNSPYIYRRFTRSPGTLRTSSEGSPKVWEPSVHLRKVHPKSGNSPYIFGTFTQSLGAPRTSTEASPEVRELSLHLRRVHPKSGFRPADIKEDRYLGLFPMAMTVVRETLKEIRL